MSEYSTINITRSTAKKKLIEYIQQDIYRNQLESFLNEILYRRLYNAIIVNDDEENDDHLLNDQ
jgi:hypothetical protein